MRQQPNMNEGYVDKITWTQHKFDCDKCGHVDEADSKTFVSCCVVGAAKLRDFLVEQRAPEIARQRKAEREQWKKDNPCTRSKREVQAATRYKGDA